MRVLTKRDRSVLGSLVVAMIVGVGGSLALAASCLGRDRAQREESAVTRFPEDQSARTSAGGIPGEDADAAVSTTRITAAELPPAGPADPATTNAPPAPPNADAPPPAPYTNTLERTAATPSPAPPMSLATSAPTATGGDAGAGAGAATTGSDGGAASPTTNGARDGGTSTNNNNAPPPHPMSSMGAGTFISEPPSFGASSWEANHEAGAGPFTTERNVPPTPGP